MRAWATAPPLATPVKLTTRLTTGRRMIPPSARVFRYLGASAGPLPGTWGRTRYVPHGLSGPSGGAIAWSVATTAIGKDVTLRIAAGHDYAYRVRVDGSPSRIRFTPRDHWSTYDLRMRFNTRKRRQIVLDLEGAGSAFLGAVQPRSGRLARPGFRIGPRTIVLGDSWTQAYPIRTPFEGYVQVMARDLGLADAWASGIGGTGFVNPGQYITFGQRLRSDVLKYHPRTVIVAGGANDITIPLAQLDLAAGSVFRRIRRAMPHARLVATGPWIPHGQTWPGLFQHADVVRRAVEANGGTFIDTTQWITGTGSTLAPRGDGGNADSLIGERRHPNAAGYAYIGHRLAAALMAAPEPPPR